MELGLKSVWSDYCFFLQFDLQTETGQLLLEHKGGLHTEEVEIQQMEALMARAMGCGGDPRAVLFQFIIQA